MYTLLMVDVGLFGLNCLLDISAMITFNNTVARYANMYVNDV